MNRRRSRRIFPPHTKYQIKWTCKKSAFSLRKEGKRAFCRPRRDAVFSVSRRAKPFRKIRRRRRLSYFLSHVIIFSLTRSSVFSASPPAWRFFSRGKHLLSAVSLCSPRDNRYWKKAYPHRNTAKCLHDLRRFFHILSFAASCLFKFSTHGGDLRKEAMNEKVSPLSSYEKAAQIAHSAPQKNKERQTKANSLLSAALFGKMYRFGTLVGNRTRICGSGGHRSIRYTTSVCIHRRFRALAVLL